MSSSTTQRSPYPFSLPPFPSPHSPPGTVVYSKWYRNSEHVTFTDVFKTFLQEAADAGAAVKVRDKLSLFL